MKTPNMEKLELGMSKEQVSSILGTKYTIAKKEIDKQDTIEIISYRNFPYEDEVYLFKFRNNQLEKWEREFLPKYKKIE